MMCELGGGIFARFLVQRKDINNNNNELIGSWQWWRGGIR